MQSMASLMSTNNNSDIAPLDDFDEEDDGGYLVLFTQHDYAFIPKTPFKTCLTDSINYTN